MIVKIQTNEPYAVIIEKGAIAKTGEVLSKMYPKSTRIMLISDTNVFPIYGRRIMNSLSEKGFTVDKFTFLAGETQKNMNTVSEMYAALADKAFTRTDLVLAVGGGVVGDMAGFAAATYLRGIDVVQVPTSLLAQVDSSIGGKTGVDLPFGKNLVGAFHQPKLVITDPMVLETLPDEYMVDGLGEVVKYACIYDSQLFEDLESGKAIDNIEDTIYKCIDCKREFVENDTKDFGQRMLLNFGHTFGHAIEKLHNFKEVSHGRAVAIGMYLVTTVSESLNLTEKGTADRIKALLIKLGLPFEDINDFESIIDATKLDKKSVGKMINLIFLSEIGKAFIHKEERNYLILKFKILMGRKSSNE
ncbi:MAG: 3-dehydroquinate synthase [Clostridia bacterium]